MPKSVRHHRTTPNPRPSKSKTTPISLRPKGLIRRAGADRWEASLNQSLSRLYQPLVKPGSSIQDMARTVLHEARALTTSQHGFVSRIDPKTGNNVCFTLTDAIADLCGIPANDPKMVFPIGADGRYAGLWGHALNTRQPFFTNHPARHPSAKGLPAEHIPVERFLSVPVLLDRELGGQIALANPQRDYTRRDLTAINRIAVAYALALQRMRFEDALKAERDFNDAILSTAGALVVVMDTAGRIVRFNKACEETTGYRAAEVLNLPFWDFLLLAEETAGVKEVFARLVAGSFPNRHENHWVAKDGKRRRIAWTNHALTDGQGAVQHVIATGLDITVQRKAEEALKQSRLYLEQAVEDRTGRLLQINERLCLEAKKRRQKERELRAAEVRYRTVAEFTHDWEYWEGRHGSLHYCSPSCARVAGYSAEEFMANPDLLTRIIRSEDLDKWDAHRQESRNFPGPKTLEFRIIRKDGSVCWVEHVCQPVLDKKGLFQGVRAANRDITQRIETELERQRLREELAHVSRITIAGQFAASLAHELNQPLAAILCSAEAAERFLSSNDGNMDEVRAALSDVQRDADRASKVIQRLRALFHKTGREQSLLQLNDIIQETTDLLHSELVLKEVSIQLTLDAKLPKIIGNRVELQQVILNLMVNALEAMGDLEPKQRQLRLLTYRADLHTIRLAVRDSGPGIPEAQLGRIFEPFFTTKATGMGIGLVISRSITEAHNGRLWAINSQDRGTTFYLALPIHQEDSA